MKIQAYKLKYTIRNKTPLAVSDWYEIDHKKTIAIDFDGVIHRYSEGWVDGSIYDRPVQDSFKFIQMLVDNGYTIVVHTTRTDASAIFKWFVEWGRAKMYLDLKGYDFYESIYITQSKPPAIAYIDDRGIRFTNWQDIVKYFI